MLRGRGLDRHPVVVYAHCAGHRTAHGVDVRSQPGLLGADRAVHVPDLVALFAQQFRHAAQQDLRVDARKIGRRVGKVQPDVAQRRGAQQGVAQGVDRHVSVRVGDAPFRVGDLHASQNQRQAVGQRVYVVSVSYSEIHSFPYFILSKLRIFS